MIRKTPSGDPMRLLSLVFLMLIVGCGKTGSGLSNTSSSPAEACQRVLDALASNDTTGIHALRLSRFEHDSVLVPNMPIGKTPTSMKDLELAWYMLDQNNQKGIRRALADYGGRRLKVISVRFTKPDEHYGPLVVHKGTEVTVRDEAGAEFVMPIFGSILEEGGRFKIVSIRD